MDIYKVLNTLSGETKKSKNTDSTVNNKVMFFYVNDDLCEELNNEFRFIGTLIPECIKYSDFQSSLADCNLSGINKIIIEVNINDDLEIFSNIISNAVSIDSEIIILSVVDQISFSIKVQEYGFHHIYFPNEINKLIALISLDIKATYLKKRTSKRISVIGAKGGVGCSFVATQLAFLLSKEREKKTYYVNYANGDGCLDILMGAKEIKSVDSDSLMEKEIDYDFVDPLMLKINDRLKLVNVKFQSQNIRENIDNITDCIATHCDFVLSDISNTSFRVTDDWLRERNDILILVCDSTFCSQRELVKMENRLRDKNSPIRIITVLIQKYKYNLRLQRKELSGMLTSEIDIIIPFDEHMDDKLVSNFNFQSKGNLVGVALDDLARMTLGESANKPRNNSKISLIMNILKDGR